MQAANRLGMCLLEFSVIICLSSSLQFEWNRGDETLNYIFEFLSFVQMRILG